ncbi:MAG: hypothetical protein ACI8Q6_002724, partial [Granulosicoccus sp.]
MIKELEQFLHLARLRQRLSIQPDGRCVRHPVSKAQKPHE